MAAPAIRDRRSLTGDSLGKSLVTFSGEASKQPGEWRIFEQLFLATIRELGVGDALTGRLRMPEAPAATADEAARTAHISAVANFQEKNGILYGRLLMSVSQGPLGYSSPAVATVIAHGPALNEINGDGYGAFHALKSKYDVTESFRSWDLEERLTAANMRSEDNLDPSRLIQEIRSIQTNFTAIGQPQTSSHLARKLYRSLPDKHYQSFKTLCKRLRVETKTQKRIWWQTTGRKGKQVKGSKRR